MRRGAYQRLLTMKGMEGMGRTILFRIGDFSMSGLTSAATIKMGRDTVPVAGLVLHAARARARFLRRGVAATPWPRRRSAPI